MEGVNMLGILIGYLSVLVFGITSLMALGLLIARQMKGAMIVFASGLLVSALIMAMAAITFLGPEYHAGADAAQIVLLVLSLVLLGTGPFVAALRGGRIFAAAMGCSALSLLILTVPVFGGEWAPGFIRELIPVASPWFILIASLLFAVGSLVCAILLPSRKTRMPLFDDSGRAPMPADDVDQTGITVLTKENILGGKPPA